MIRSIRARHFFFLALVVLPACESADPTAALRHVEHLCEQEEVRVEYLDFYWDDLRTRQPELWDAALDTCTDTCPDAVNCGPVLSVASWYEPTSAGAQPINSGS